MGLFRKPSSSFRIAFPC